MPHFNEHALEMAIIELFSQEGYTYTNGEQIHKELSDVLLRDDFRAFLRSRYAVDGIMTPLEVESAPPVWRRMWVVCGMSTMRIPIGLSRRDSLSSGKILPKPTSSLNRLTSSSRRTISSVLSISWKSKDKRSVSPTVLYISTACRWWCWSSRAQSKKTPPSWMPSPN